MSKYEIIDNRTDKTVAASALLAGADWLDENGRVIFDDLDEAIDNGNNSVYRVIVGDYVAFVEVENQIIALHDAGTTFEDYLDLWDTGDATTAELFAEWGLDGLSKLSEVDDDYIGPTRVWVEHNYYGGTLGAPTDGFARDAEQEVLEFDSAAQAREWIDGEDSGTYYLAHGEAGRPA